MKKKIAVRSIVVVSALALLGASCAWADDAAPAPAPIQTYEELLNVLYRQAYNCEHIAAIKLTALQSQIDKLTAERDALKARLPAEAPNGGPDEKK